MSKFNLNKSANLSKDLNLIEKDSIDGEDIYKYKDPFWSSFQDGKCDYAQGKGKLFDSSRYEYFAREGSGIVALGFEDTNKVPVKIFDGNIYNKEGVFKVENAKLNFQGHARIHVYVSEEQAKKLQAQGLSALTKPVSFTQEDWEDRVFVLKSLF